jgi:zinc transport system ATP-binding protein
MPVVKPLFALHHVSFHIDGKEILSGLSLDIHRGEYIGIIGPNGGGKTTLLRLLLGLAQPTHGTINRQIAPARIGYVPQRMNGEDVTFPATVREIVASGIVTASSNIDRERRVREAMATTNIHRLKDQRIGTLSGGERQRVMIARALAGEPDVLFLDEPTSAIDPGSQEEFYSFLRKLHAKGLTIVMVSHDTDAISHEVKRVLCLNRHLVCHGTPDDVMHKVHIDHYGH